MKTNINVVQYRLFNSKTMTLRSTSFSTREKAREAKRASSRSSIYRIAKMRNGRVAEWVR